MRKSLAVCLALFFCLAAESLATTIVVGGGGNNLVVFDPSGNYLSTVSIPAGGGTAYDIAQAPSGDIFVSRSDGTVVRFDSTLNFVTSWNVGFSTLYGIGVNASGLVYAAGSGSSTVRVYDANGVFQTALSPSGSANLRDVAFVGANTWVTNFSGNKFDVFDPGGSDIGDITAPAEPFGARTASNGDVWVVGQDNHEVRRIDPAGNTVFSFDADNGPFGSLTGQVRQLGVDAAGLVYVSGFHVNRVDVYNSTGNYQYSLSHNSLSNPGGVLVTSVPEPSSLTLIGLFAIGLAGYVWRARKR